MFAIIVWSFAAGYESSVMSIDQARKFLLSLSLAQIAAQHYKISLEMATLQKMRRELDVMDRSGSAQTIADDLQSLSGNKLQRRAPTTTLALSPLRKRSELNRRVGDPPAGNPFVYPPGMRGHERTAK